ncbi:MAG: sigma-54 dependent transcriptional regulator [Elusimicrobia bacterium]|nr:sigma-54 dependent transcriptional regulator [Elusimicrobiota bacterium]
MTEVKSTILVVDDDLSVIESYKILLEDKYNVLIANDGTKALEILQKESVNLVLLDILMPGMDGLETLKKIKEDNEVEVIMITAVRTVRTAIQAVKLGAYDYITKPFDIDDLLATINKVLEKQGLNRQIIYLKAALKNYIYENMVGKSEKITKVFNMISEVSNNDSTILITGESGTGKELIARAIHNKGSRKDKPFIAVDCASIPENLVESELFGHEKGAFTDATTQRIGRFELSSGGTLFLDEIGNLKLDIQSKILRVLEEREIQRIGSSKIIKIDSRIISATNVDLKKAVKAGQFREDLYYRLNVIPIFAPALRERKEDIPMLVDYFIDLYNKEFNKKVSGVSEEAVAYLSNYDWPGNVRELRNVMERLIALSKENIISHKRLPVDILLSQEIKPEDYYATVSLKAARYEFEKQFVLKVLEKANWNQTKAAKLLGIHRNAIIFKIEAFNLRPIIKQAKLDLRSKK